MNNTNIVVSLDTRRTKQDGTYPLVLRVGHNKRTTAIPLGVSLLEKDWDEERRKIKKSYSGTSNITRLTNLIEKKKSDAMDIILKLEENGQLQKLSVTELRDKIDRQNINTSFYQFGERLVQDLIKANRIGTARSYKGVLAILKTFHGKEKELYFNDITYSFLTKLETYHFKNGNEANGLAVYMRTIRAIYNKAIKEELVEPNLYPFTHYAIKTVPTQKRALEWEFLKKIIDLKLEPSDACFNARNYFLASYMMYGMNFKDMAFLLKTDIAHGRIYYRRDKTSKLYDIKITPSLQTILSYYIDKDPDSKYVFPIIKREHPILQDKDILWARKRYNMKLKDVAALCKIEKNLTSYVSRHSFATQALLQEIPVAAISTMLGHSNLKTTQTYLKTLPSNILDDYNSRILGAN